LDNKLTGSHLAETIVKEEVTMGNNDKTPENVGVINPYALAEVVLKQSVDWEQVDTHEVLKEAFAKPYEELFDPKYESPLYTGLKLNRETLDMERAELPTDIGFPKVDAELLKTDAEVTDADLQVKEKDVPQVLARVSATATWKDPGSFFKEAAEMSDPVQGALGDCYFIAALSSVAWADTYVIAHKTRATGTTQQAFVDMIELYDGDKPVKVEVSELLPLNPPANNYIYARSSEKGEIWPAIYEKAYAKWRTNDPGDKPNYAPIAGGDPVRAAAQLTGLKRYYYWTAGLSAHDIWQKVRQNSLSRKTFNPVVAWTYPSGDKSPDKVNYNNAHLVANHAYSILGWDYVNGQEYVVLRNPWGTYEATLNIAGGTWIAWDAPYYGGPGWWRPVQMATVDGIFGLRADAFKKYFAGFGWVE
jgi:hypothetical protein